MIAHRDVVDTVLPLLQEKLGDALTSAALYGSVARGKARPESDIDLLLVLRDPPASCHDRLMPVFEAVAGMREVFADRGSHELPEINFLVLSEDEAREARGIYLDMVEEAVLLIDRGDFLCRKLDEVRGRMEE